MAQKNKNGPLGTQSSADAQRSEMFEASVLKSASMEAQEIVQEGEKEARKIVEEARRSSVDTQLDAYRRAAKRTAALEAAVARRENRDRLLRYRTPVSYTHLDVYKRQGCAALALHSFTGLCRRSVPMPALFTCAVWLVLAVGGALALRCAGSSAARLGRARFVCFWGTVYFAAELIAINLLKLVWARTRFDDMLAAGDFSRFTSWLQPFGQGLSLIHI